MANNILKVGEAVKQMVQEKRPDTEIKQFISQSGWKPETFVKDFKLASSNMHGMPLGNVDINEPKFSGTPGEVYKRLQAKEGQNINDLYKNIALGFVNTAGAGIPGGVAKLAGHPIPEPQTTAQKTGRTIGNVGGFAAGIPSMLGKGAVSAATRLIPSLVGKKVVPSMAKLGIESATAVGTSDIPRAIEKPGEVAKETAIAGTVGAGLPLAGAAVKSASKGLERIVGGITKGTQDWIAKRGAKTVFQPEKAQTDYIGKVIVPKVQERIAKSIESKVAGTENMLIKLGIPQEDAAIINQISPEKRKFVSDIIRGKSENVANEIAAQKKAASNLYGKILKDVPDDTTIDVKDTFFKLKRNLQDMGIIDASGNFKADIDIPQLGRVPEAIQITPQRKLAKIYYELLDYVKFTGGKTTVSDYQRILNDELESAISNNPRWDRIVTTAQGALRKSATKSIPKLEQANKIYSDASKLDQIHKSIMKLSEDTKQPLSVILENQIYTLRDPRKFQTRNVLEKIMGKENYENTLDHIVNIDYGVVSELPGAAGGIYPSISGMRRLAATVGGKGTRQLFSKLPNIPSSPLLPSMTKLGIELNR